MGYPVVEGRMFTQSPTLELIRMNATKAAGSDGAQVPPTEVERLRAENQVLRKRLAQLTAQYIWTEGGSFAKIDSDIRQYGYRLDWNTTKSGKDPRMVPL